MVQPITHVAIGGTTLDLSDVEYQVGITHGRNDIKSSPEASTAQIIIRGAAGVDIAISDSVDITAWDTRRFTGEVTDLNITHLSAVPPVAITTVTAIGNLANLGARWTGADGYSKETVYARAETILTDSGEAYLNGGTDTLELFATTAGVENAVTCTDGLQQLAEWSGGTYFDLPDGRIVFESYGNRGLTAYRGVWSSNTEAWSFYERSWDSFPTSFAAVPLPDSTVVYTPTWSQNQASLINDVTVTHGDPAHSDQAEDMASIAQFGRRTFTLTTGLDKHSDAISRADAILLAQAYPLWNLGNISVLMDHCTEEQRNQILGLVSGSSVLVNDLPEPAPFDQFLGIVEGWAETYTPGQHILTLSISDPRYSYQTVEWGQIQNTTATRTNLVTNPSFEVDTAGWIRLGALATLSRITTDSVFGTSSAQIVRATNTGGGVNQGLDTNSTSYFSITPNQTYIASSYVKAVSGSPDLFINIAWHTAAGAYISETGITISSVGAVWQRISQSGTAPATAAFARILVRERVSASEAAATWLVDAVLLEQSSTLNPYFDGSYADPAIAVQTQTWNGTANASTSTLTYYTSQLWSQVNPEIIWYNVVTSDDLIAA
ncbi:MAG: phage head spike fiber domain-containing protein [Candidatus Nanopelagicales bacterium]